MVARSLARRAIEEIIGSSAFAPSDLANLVAWYDANDISTLWQDSARSTPVASDSDVAGAWDDKSGNGYHVTQGTTANKPLYKTAIQNGKPVLRFDGTDDILTNTSFFDFADTYTVFLVSKSDVSVDSTQAVLEASTGTVNTGFNFILLPSITWRVYLLKNVTDSDLRNGNFYLHTGIRNGTASQYWQNSVSVGTATGDTNSNTLNRLDVGGLSSLATYRHDGDIAEIIIYSDALSTNQIAQVETYLNNKWSVY